ncbi:MAG: hypothetical protein ABWY78_07785 [Microvirga sp.]
MRSTLDPADGVVVGQAVSLYVDVLFADAMPRPPRVRVPDAPGAQVMRFESQGVTIRDSIAGRNHVGQRFTFEVFPRRGGALTIPAAEVAVLDPQGNVSGSAKGSAVTMDVGVPRGIDASGPVMASKRVTASQAWSPDPATGLAAGGAISRTITREAADVPSLGMSVLAFTAPDGVRAYVDPPASDDRINRGAVTGHRIDKVTYVFERAGTFEIPALSQPWWDLATNAVQDVTLPGAKVVVAAAAPPVHAAPGLWRNPVTWLAVAGLLVLSVMARTGWPHVREAWTAGSRRRASSEHAARRALARIARTGDAPATYRALTEWRSRMPRGEADVAAVHDLQCRIERSLFSGRGEPWTPEQGRRLARALRSIPRSGRPRTPVASLPPLNPVARS